MMKEYKRRLEILSMYDFTGITAHLEKMAQKGWALERIRNSVWRYRRIEPARLHYAVVYLPDSSQFDPGPTDSARDMAEFCAEAGWEQVASQAQMHIFVHPGPDPIPIDTDPGLQIETLHRAMKKNYLPSQWLMLGLSLLQLVLSGMRYNLDPIGFLTLNSNYVGLLCWGLVAAMSVWELWLYFSWRKKALRAAADGNFLPTKGSRKFQLFCLGLTTAGFLWMLLSLTDGKFRFTILFSLVALVLIQLAVYGIKGLLQRRGAKASTTRAAVWGAAFGLSLVYCLGLGFFATHMVANNWFEEEVPTYEHQGMTWEHPTDEIPLRIEDLTETDYRDYSSEYTRQAGLLLTMTECRQEPKMDALAEPGLYYSVYSAATSGIADLVFDEFAGDRDEYLPAGTVAGAQVFRLVLDGEVQNRVILRSGKALIALRADFLLTDEMLQTAAETLLPGT